MLCKVIKSALQNREHEIIKKARYEVDQLISRSESGESDRKAITGRIRSAVREPKYTTQVIVPVYS